MAGYEEKTVSYTANGEKELFYLSAGPKDGPLLIFIHGWPAIAKTWKAQLDYFSAKGYHVVAPDMPGYGKSTANKVREDYSQEIITAGLLALLKDVGQTQAVWIGHDWGVGVVSALAAVHPEVCKGVVLMSVPYRILELGIDALVEQVNREIYPVDKYPFGQWEYQVYYERSFEEATALFDSDIRGLLKALYARGNPESMGKPAITASVVQDGGWFGGAKELPAFFQQIPWEAMCIDEPMYNELVAAMEKTSFWGADAYYANHARNKEYILSKEPNGGVLEFPLLFIEAKYDAICDTAISTMSEPMRKHCKKLTEVSIAAGHWVAQESPEETNKAIESWLTEKAKI